MTTKPTVPRPAHFSEKPRRGDMQNFDHLALPGHPPALRQFLGAPATTLVTGDAAVGWSVSRQLGNQYPDLLIAFSVDPADVRAQRGYGIHRQGKPPDFVLEVASFRTAYNDYNRKRRRYAEFGIPEYWRFDATGGRLYPTPLAGDRLSDGQYQPITVIQTGDGMHRGRSAVLNLDLCWEHGMLRWHDPATQSYLRTYDASEADRRASEAGRIAAEAERDAERATRLAAEAERDAEREARLAAEARIRSLEQELRRRPPDSAP